MDISYIENKLREWNHIELFLRERYFSTIEKSVSNHYQYILSEDELKKNQFLLNGNHISSTVYNKQMNDASVFSLREDNLNITFCRHNRYTPVFLHEHTFYEIIYILSGYAHNTINNEKILLTAGDVIIIPIGVKHEIEVFNDDTILMNIIIRNTTFKDVFFDFINQDNVLSKFFLNNMYMKNKTNYIMFHTGENREIKDTFYEMYIEFIEKKLYSEFILPNLLKVFFCRILRYYDRCVEISVKNDEEDMLAVSFIQYIQKNYKTVTLTDIAEAFHFTEPYTSKIIRRVTGHTFSQLVQKIRMDHAISLMKNTDCSISAISETVGYSNPEHFIRLFKKIYHVAPGEYRVKQRS